MTSITTTLTTSGNSVAVRLPGELLRMSGLTDRVKLEAKKGKIIITSDDSPREAWGEQIQVLMEGQDAMGNSVVAEPTAEFSDMDVAVGDGLEDLPWDGPTFEEWQKQQKDTKGRG